MWKIKHFRNYSYNIDWYFLLRYTVGNTLQHMRKCTVVQSNADQNQPVSPALPRARNWTVVNIQLENHNRRHHRFLNDQLKMFCTKDHVELWILACI